jgi:hypothetical protein
MKKLVMRRGRGSATNLVLQNIITANTLKGLYLKDSVKYVGSCYLGIQNLEN